MSGYALGLIETCGLIAAIEATDAAAKAAAVVVTSAEVTDSTFVTIRIEGELGAVQAAVEAGASAAEKVGEIVAVHIIPNPDIGLGAIMPPRCYVSKYRPDDNRPSLCPDDSLHKSPVAPNGGASVAQTKSANRAPDKSGPQNKISYKEMTVSELRRVARTLTKLELKGRQISTANKKQLIDAIKRVLDMD